MREHADCCSYLSARRHESVSLAVWARIEHLSCAHGQATNSLKTNRPIALRCEDHMTIFSCTVSRYGTMDTTTPARTDVAAGEEAPDGREQKLWKRSRVAICRRVESDDDARIGGAKSTG
jgi:hypothetical protein